MKKILFAVTVLFIIISAVSCGKTASANSKTLRFNNGTEPQSLDPAITTGQTEFHILMQIFEGLTVYDPKDLSPKPGVAESWDVSNKGLIYTFHLRTNSFWSDGTPVDSETFRYSWLRALAPETASEYAYQLWYIKNAEKYTKKLTNAGAVAIETPDKYTLRVTLESPTPYFINLTAFQTFMPTPKHVIDKIGTDRWIRQEYIVCNGPFKLKEWKSKSYIKLVKNPSYWDKESVKLDSIYLYAYEDNSSSLDMFLNGELDWVDSIPSERMEQMEVKPEFHKSPFLGTYFYNINVRTNKQLADKNIRRALYLTINRDFICRYIGKAGQIPAYGFVPASMPGYEHDEYEKENPDKARKLMADAGYPDGKGFPQLTILYNTSEDHKKIAEAIQQMWKKELGIDVMLENQEWKVYLQKMQALDYQIGRRGWIGDYVDPNTFLDMFVTDGGNNQTGWSNPQYDYLIKQAKIEQDPTNRMKLFRQAEKILIDELPIIPMYTYVRVYAMKTNVQGVYENILDLHPLKEVTVIR